MALMLRRGRDGELRPYWYAEVQTDGRRRVKNLGVKWLGTPPASLREEGDSLRYDVVDEGAGVPHKSVNGPVVMVRVVVKQHQFLDPGPQGEID